MYFCPVCNKNLKANETNCGYCGSHLYDELETSEAGEQYELKPRFVFVYELLPSSIQTIWLLIVLFIVSNLIREYFHLPTASVVALFAGLLLLKDLKIFYRKFKYRNVKYIISDHGIEYIKESSHPKRYFLPYEEVSAVLIEKNYATRLFGYGHILVKSGSTGIYLDYIADVDQVYQYIIQHIHE